MRIKETIDLITYLMRKKKEKKGKVRTMPLLYSHLLSARKNIGVNGFLNI